MAKKTSHICSSCGTSSAPKTHTKGNILIELILWLCLIVPGLIYSIWRLTTKHQICPKCKSPDIVALNTPRGAKLQQEFETQ